MKGNQKIIDALNHLLGYELAAMDQYFIHSEMYADWGLQKLYDRISHESVDEKGHAKVLIERILFLNGTPDLITRPKINIEKEVPAMLKSDLEVEYEVARILKDLIKLCEAEQDYHTRTCLIPLLSDTEIDHAWWLEKQLGLIESLGLQNYLQSQM